MSYQEQGGESVVVNGTVEGVEVKQNGRFVIRVREIGSTSQYALSLNTKEQGLANQMMGAVGQQFSFICGLSHWTNQMGQPVTSKWINGVAPLQGAPQPQYQPQPQPQPQGQSQPVWQPPPSNWQPPQPQGGQWGPDTIRRVSFLAALEPAVAMLNHLPEEQRNVPALVQIADFFAKTAILRGERGFNDPPTAPSYTSPPTDSAQGNPSPSQVDALLGDPGPQDGDPGPDYDSVPY